MIYIESDRKDPYFNLALEEYVFNSMDRSREYFMLWQNENTIVVGKYQNTAEEINQAYVDTNGIKVVRRLSGGGAVYHDAGNLNFTFIVDEAHNPQFDFSLFAQPVVDALKQLGVEASFTGRNDIAIGGRKFSGNSQYCRGGRILHHGCIMVDSRLDHVAEALQPKEAKFESKSTKSVKSRVTSISENSSSPISVDSFKAALRREIFRDRKEERYTLTDGDIKAIEKLAQEKYSTWEWNYGKSATYNFHNCKKYPFGLVEISAAVEEGVIREIRFSGDFFGNEELAELSDALCGMAVDEDLAENIERAISVGYYINGMTAQDIADQLRL